MRDNAPRRFDSKELTNRTAILVHSHRSNTSCLEQLRLAEGTRCLSAGPDRCLVVSDSASVDSVLAQCRSQLSGVCAAVDVSDACISLQLSGEHAREVLSSGTGIDLREPAFSTGSCKWTRLAGTGVIIESVSHRVFEITFDRSLERYMTEWLFETARNVSLAA